MATAYKTPGVYVEEVSLLPASVAQVETAIPAFVGFTAKSPETNKAIPISSLRDFEEVFGKAEDESFDITITDKKDEPRSIDIKPTTNGSKHSKYKLYHSLRIFFDNGGGKCYIVSVGSFSDNITKTLIDGGIQALEKEDEPTLILFPDATSLSGGTAGASYYNIAQNALSQAATLGDRFVLVDVFDDNVQTLRDNIGTNNLMYSAAYYPHLQTNFSYNFDEEKVVITHTVDGKEGSLPKTLAGLKDSNSGLYNDLKMKLNEFKVVLPPSPAIAGIYASVDRNYGVWKAPANVSINSILNPVIKVSNAEQDGLNIDAESGKSINAIRTFAGKGTLVWGARTLDGNDNEWKYISVRRFYNMVEESLRKSTSWAVFEPNDAHTWIRVKSMIQNYLIGLWKQGALAGATPDQAFFVKIGLGETMTSIEILEGRMNVEVGLATVRPAEFIVLKFSHKLQE